MTKRILAAVVLAIALLGLALTFGLPPLIQSQIESRGSEALGREVKVGQVELAWWRLALTLHQLSVGGAPGQPPQLAIERLHAQADWRSVWRLAPVLATLQIDSPRLRITHLAPGRYDIDDILARFTAPSAAPPSEPARFALFNIELRDGEVVFDDRPVSRQHHVRGVQLALPFLSNLADDIAVQVQPRLAFAYDGSHVDLRGQTLPFAPDRASELQIDWAELKLQPLWAYLPKDLPVQPRGGVLGTKLTLRFAQPPKATPQLTLQGQLQLRDFAVDTATPGVGLALTRLELPITKAQPLQRQLALGDVVLAGAKLQLRRDAQGRWELPEFPATPANAPATPPWQINAQRLTLSDAEATLADASTQPAAALVLRGLQLAIDNPRWPAQQPVAVQAQAELHAAGQPAGRLSMSGQASPSSAQLTAELQDFPLSAVAPYLKAVLKPTLEGQAQAQMQLDWASGEQPKTALTLSELRIERLRLWPQPRTRQAAAWAQWSSLAVKGVMVDGLQQRIEIAGLQLSQPQIALARDAEGQLNVQQWLVAQPARATAPAEPDRPWRLVLRELRLDGGRVDWADAAVQPAVALTLQDLQLTASGLAWPQMSRPARMQLSARLPDQSRLAMQGELALAPLALRSQLTLERLPLQRLEPYFRAQLPVQLARAELSWRGSVNAALPGDATTLKLDAQGQLRVADLDVRTRADAAGLGGDDPLLSWQSLQLDPLRVAIKPGSKPRIEIGELALADFYSRLVITEQGRFNLRDVQGPPEAARARTELPIELVINRTQLSAGRVDFSDRFIRPNYSAALSELNGTIGRFASDNREMAPIDLRGRVAGTGLLEIRGALNPTANPLALDISARATDLELAPLSPYSGKYAGYAIERGKLSVDVAYRIDPDGKLDARNQIVLNQLTFGDKVDSPDATKLPVRLAVALLADRNGVIDINLPVSGSINDPQFSIWGIVWKIIGNLIAKALTAPFALLAGAGGGPELSTIGFAPGTARLAEGGTQAVERIAKALAERPALRMTVVGHADLAAEKAAIQSAAIDERLRAEQRRDQARAGTTPETPPPALGVDEAARLVERLYKGSTLPNRPRNMIGMLKTLPAAEMRAMLEAAVPVTSDTVRELALQRSLFVRDALIAKGLPSERLFLGAPKVGEGDAPRVELTLAVP